MIVLSATTSNEPRRCRVLRQPFTLVAAFLFGFYGFITYVQADAHPAQTTDSPEISVLDGKTFSGELGRVGKPGLADLFVFREGMFVSKECEKRCGYPAGPYWVSVPEPISCMSTATWGRQACSVGMRSRVSRCVCANQSRFVSK